MDGFEGKVAVITGGASGLGLAMAQRFADAGVNIVIGDIEAEPLAMAEAAIAARGVKVLARRTDVAKQEDVEALAKAAYERFGAVHILCNNAGIGGSPGASWELSLDDWRWVIDVDLWSVIHGVRSFVPRMIASGEESHVVNTASVAGLVSGAVGGPYTVAKFGVVALSEQLYFELGRAGHPIGVSVLCPGFVNTNIFDSGRNRQTDYGDSDIGATPEGEQRRAALNAMRSTMIQPAEIGELVFEAIRTRSLYIIPTGSKAIENAVRARLENVVERRNPGLDFSIL
ncbi:MAG: SDR family NAD(P)-dependent oxidoreductase [Dehalococcoidia bacterium]|uniref:SDR family NAD(P)-dependent oxidoreductase n=1 Tax=Candidatus Amarobacter glycogenicus TaxID=3140699 RepID=UPI003134A08D|nr:SDR family NAD(P)-dependent oxidoreductase [Dehalococcoidia bacterium]